MSNGCGESFEGFILFIGEGLWGGVKGVEGRGRESVLQSGESMGVKKTDFRGG